ncbi:hypothetical protein AAIH25_15065 [Arthrobacter crystallopoietes]|uniref:hypothetical protein n=1 Tax=Crystallibacter crystallopoietes TaxID=37928 RepID=UPI003D1A92C0
MTVENDAALLLAHLDSIGVDGSEQVARGWNHIGAVLVDAALQRQRNYARVVEPRVRLIKDTWPDADTTSGFLKRMDNEDLARTIKWNGPSRIRQIEQVADVLSKHDVETVGDFRAGLENGGLRTALKRVKYVGPKTLDYLEILVGISSVAVDSRILKITRAAGMTSTSYDHIAEVIRAAADQRGWRHGDLDAALWRAGEDL